MAIFVVWAGAVSRNCDPGELRLRIRYNEYVFRNMWAGLNANSCLQSSQLSNRLTFNYWSAEVEAKVLRLAMVCLGCGGV